MSMFTPLWTRATWMAVRSRFSSFGVRSSITFDKSTPPSLLNNRFLRAFRVWTGIWTKPFFVCCFIIRIGNPTRERFPLLLMVNITYHFDALVLKKSITQSASKTRRRLRYRTVLFFKKIGNFVKNENVFPTRPRGAVLV